VVRPPAPRPAPPPTTAAAPWTWTFASDVERIDALFVAGRDVWGVSQLGLVHWDRQSGAVRIEGPTAPGAEVTAIASGPDGTVYAGLPSGIAWRTSEGTWARTGAGPLSGGVTALAPRAAGGVWVGLAGGLAWFEAGLLHVVNDRHRVRAFSVSPEGVVWAATDGFGVVRLGDELLEFTTGQGVCGNQIRAVFAGAGGRVGVTCLETRNRNRFSIGVDGRFTTYEMPELQNPIERVEPLADRVLLWTVGADFQLEVESPLPATRPGAGPQRPADGPATPPGTACCGRRYSGASAAADSGRGRARFHPRRRRVSPAPGPASAAVAPGAAPPATGVADELTRLAAGQVPPPAAHVALPRTGPRCQPRSPRRPRHRWTSVPSRSAAPPAVPSRRGCGGPEPTPPACRRTPR
jgi:hypothetical protein